MTYRITMKDLEAVTLRLNRMKDTPETPWTQNADKSLTANIGNYNLDGAYGGWRLVQVVSEGGGIRVVSIGGFTTKRELYNQIQAILNA